MQEGVIAIEITSLALQMYTTVSQLCSSYAYQTTSVYHACAEASGNKFNKLCGPFVGGAAAFEPFTFEPCKSQMGLSQVSSYTNIQFYCSTSLGIPPNLTWRADRT